MLISIEGVDGAGKTSAIQYICRRIKSNNVLSLSFPSNSIAGKAARESLMNNDTNENISKNLIKDFEISCKRMIKPSLDEGVVVVCDRYIDSFIAYQGASTSLKEAYREIRVKGLIKPDVVIFLDINPINSLNRIKDKDNFEKTKSMEFFHNVRANYLLLYINHTQTVFLIDADRPQLFVLKSLDKVIDRINNIISSKNIK